MPTINATIEQTAPIVVTIEQAPAISTTVLGVGARGATGTTGVPGATGAQGAQGNQGIQGEQGVVVFATIGEINTGTEAAKGIAPDTLAGSALQTKADSVETNADVTDTANVTSSGALMDSELASIADVKALDQSVVNGATPAFTTTNFTDASNKRLMSDAQETVLDNTSNTNTGDEPSASLTVQGIVELATIAEVNTGTDATRAVTPDSLEGSALQIKVDGIEALADVTDTANVVGAGALMDSELTAIADVKALDQSVVSGATPTFGNDNFTEATDKNYVTDAEAVVIGNTSNTNTGDQTLTESSKSITLELPTATEDVSMFFTSEAITITKMIAVLTAGGGSESVTWKVRHHTDRNNAGNAVVTAGTATTSLTTGSVVTSFNDATIPENSFVWLETTAMANDPGTFNLTIIYDKD